MVEVKNIYILKAIHLFIFVLHQPFFPKTENFTHKLATRNRAFRKRETDQFDCNVLNLIT